MIKDQTGLHSVLLPSLLLIIILKYIFVAPIQNWARCFSWPWNLQFFHYRCLYKGKIGLQS